MCDMIKERGDTMRDLPVFTTENGVASLVLKEIPYRQEAYIRILDSLTPEELLKECIGFCRAAGAEKIYAADHPCCEEYPVHTRVLKLRGSCPEWETEANLFPVQEHTLPQWLKIYNEKMRNVDNASYMTEQQGMDLVKNGNAYFVHKDAKLLGIAAVKDNQILALASCVPGGGSEIIATLCRSLGIDQPELEVASTNQKALSLYEKTGFIAVEEKSLWRRVF